MTESDTKSKRAFVRKSGKTLLVKILNTSNEFSIESLNLTGLVNKYYTEKSNSYFLTFDNPVNSLNALHLFKKDYDTQVRVKFAHYRVFFTLENMSEDMDYNTIKTQHRELVQSQNNCSVLYYKLYRKGNKYLGCGDMTIDTKEGLDNLMNEEGLKTFKLDCGLSGSHYRYRNKQNNNSNQDVELSVSNS